MATIRVERRIAADPTGTALLLAGQTALDLWPGVTRLAPAPPGHVLVEARVPALRARAARVAVQAAPPRRLPTSYVTAFRFAGDLPATEGTVTLTRSWSGERPATTAELALTWEGGDARLAAALRAMAHGFLANLADAAEERSFAA
ncbi:MAG TPA: hypothetical protein VGX28_07840 [Frankiaceae bacterium]|jgi:hypothetical protein|nr:hypothetical protein [Frankiaceae bacterium]